MSSLLQPPSCLTALGFVEVMSGGASTRPNAGVDGALRSAHLKLAEAPKSDIASDGILLRPKLPPQYHNVNFTVLDKDHSQPRNGAARGASPRRYTVT